GYLDAGVPAEKLNLGLPMYGRAWAGVELGDNDDALFQLGSQPAPGSWEPGIYDYKHLHDGKKNGTDIEIEYTPDQYHWDEEARVPYLYNPDSKIFSSYEDTRSIEEKVDYAKDQGLGGVFFWEISGDLPIEDEDSLLKKAYEGLSNLGGTQKKDQQTYAKYNRYIIKPEETVVCPRNKKATWDLIGDQGTVGKFDLSLDHGAHLKAMVEDSVIVPDFLLEGDWEHYLEFTNTGSTRWELKCVDAS
ncbi:MAG: glycoside hydrolase family 18 protein, partial [Okeania sp. SIO3C4]|nr:glycoside hydrolase family 18 protein [Okeania sp. SIO3C4]